jgi:hypothetical protein
VFESFVFRGDTVMRANEVGQHLKDFRPQFDALAFAPELMSSNMERTADYHLVCGDMPYGADGQSTSTPFPGRRLKGAVKSLCGTY